MRILFVCALGLAIAYAVEDKSESRDIVQCSPQAGDLVLLDAEIVDEGHNVGVVDLQFKYPGKGTAQKREIHCIVVKDLKPSEGSKAVIVDGGVGMTNVTINFTSEFRYGIDFTINIMGK